MGTIHNGRKHEKIRIFMKKATIQSNRCRGRDVLFLCGEEFQCVEGFSVQMVMHLQSQEAPQLEVQNHKMLMLVFNLISTHLKKTIKKFGYKVREMIIELCDTKNIRGSAFRSSRKSYGKA